MPRRAIIRLATIVLLAMVVPTAAFGGADELEGKMVKKRPFSFFLPTKWWSPFLFFGPKKRVHGRELSYTKDGFALDVIQFKSQPISRAFSNSKKKIAEGMSPFEMAQVVIDDLGMYKPMMAFKVLENRPVTVCGRSGFRIVYSYTDNGTLQYKSVYYGFQSGKTYYTIRYGAPAIHYFDTYLLTFEKIVKSATLTGSDIEAAGKQEFDAEPERGDEER